MKNINPKLLLTLAITALVCGCSESDVSQIEDLQTVSLFSRGDQIPRVMSYINSKSRYEQNEFRKNVITGLNRWAGNLQQADKEIGWTEPSLLETLPDSVTQSKTIQNLDSEFFYPFDANYVQGSSWMDSITERVLAAENVNDFNWLIYTAKKKLGDDQVEGLDPDQLLEGVLAELHSGLTDEEAAKLAKAIRLFDWTVRNIQLATESPWLDGDELSKESLLEEGSIESATWAPSAGAPGPGYGRFPWQLIMYGRGDWIERANFFIGLLSHANIDAVMLAIENDEESNNKDARPYTEWAPAVIIGEQLFLFDTFLGIPIPGKEPGQIATLQQIIENPELLSNLNLTVDESIEKQDYRVTQEQLDNVIALVAAPPESISKRMALLESKLSGEYRMNLTRDIENIAEQVSDIESIKSVKIWHVPFSIHQYRETLENAMAMAMNGDQRLAQKLYYIYEGEQYIDGFPAFRAAKNLFVRGQFESPRDVKQLNAIRAFNLFMYSDSQIASFERDERMQMELGVFKPNNQSYNEWKSRLINMKNQMNSIRADASFYLALSHYENGYPSTALNWLERVESFDDEGRWAYAVRYHKARAHEAGGDFQKAIDLLKRKGSPQRHGDIIRTRLLEELVEPSTTP